MNNERFSSPSSFSPAVPRLNLQALPSSRPNAAQTQTNAKDPPEGALHPVGAGHKLKPEHSAARANRNDAAQQRTAAVASAAAPPPPHEPVSEGSSPESHTARAGLQLRRVAFMNDGNDTRLLLFTLPSALVRGFVRVATSPEFIVGGHSWHVVAERGDRHIGLFVALKNAPAEQLSIDAEYTFTLVNREHFCRNESFGTRPAPATFSTRHTSDGRRQFVPLADLNARGFLYDSGRALIELEFGNVRTVFAQELPLSLSALYSSNAAISAFRRQFDEPSDDRPIESAAFQYGGCEWHMSLWQSSESQRVLRLERHTSRNIKLLVSYRLQTLAPREELLGDCGSDWSLQVDPKVGHLALSLRFERCVAITEFELFPLKKERNWARVFDASGREWILECDMFGDTVKLRLFLSNAATLLPPPRALALRLNLFVLGANGRRLRAVGNPIAHYFTGDPSCYMRVPLDVTMQQLIDPESGFVCVETGIMKVLIEWLDAVLLSADAFDAYDASIGIQKIQMRREIAALQAENYQLEKQVFSYQQSISRLSNSTPHSPAHATSTQRSSSLQTATVDGLSLQPRSSTASKLERQEALQRGAPDGSHRMGSTASTSSSSGVVTEKGPLAAPGRGSHDSCASGGSASGDSSSISTVRSYNSNASPPPPLSAALASAGGLTASSTAAATSSARPPPLPQKRTLHPDYERTSSRSSMGLQGNGGTGATGSSNSNRVSGRPMSNNAHSSSSETGTPVRSVNPSRSERAADSSGAVADNRYNAGPEGSQAYWPQAPVAAEKRGGASRLLPAPPPSAEPYDDRAGMEWSSAQQQPPVSFAAARVGARMQPGVVEPSRIQDARREKTASRSAAVPQRDERDWYKQ